MDEREKQKIEEERAFVKEKRKRVERDKQFFKTVFILLTLIMLVMLGILIYFLSTADEREEFKFDNDLLTVFGAVLNEKDKKEIDLYYEYIGMDPSLRESSKEKEYEDISKIIQADINEDFYILEEAELKKLGLENVSGRYLVNYDLMLVFALDPYQYKDGTVKYTLDRMLSHYTASKDIDGSGANAPQILQGMTPVIYNEEVGDWEFVSDLELDVWYNYENKMWANVMLQDYTDGDSSNVDGSMYVWIPRYAYKIASNNYHSSIAGIIDVKFLVDDTNTAYDGTEIDPNNTDSSKDYVIHPAFRSFDELSGIWVSKFEASTAEYGEEGPGKTDMNNPNLTYKSYFDRYSWTNMDMKNQYLVGKNMVNNHIYGLNVNETDTHMMKNIEWGAIAYLAQSPYGRNANKIWANNYYDDIGTKTGYSAKSSSDKKYGEEIDYVTFMWNSSNGMRATTTGNVYGVYDLVGGAIERMAAFLDNESDSLKQYGMVMLQEMNRDYVDVYYVHEEDTQLSNYNMTIYKYGDAIWETSLYGHNNSKSSWYSSSSGMMNNQWPFIFRGGSAVIREENAVGLFYFSPSSGGPNTLSAFRTVIIAKDNVE